MANFNLDEQLMLDFVYVNYHSSDDVISSISSLKRLLTRCALPAHIYIADNSFLESNPFVVQALSSFAKSVSAPSFYVSYCPSDRNMGFGAACNKVSRLCSSPLVVFVNCDTDFEDTEPAKFLSFLESMVSDNIVIAGPKILSEYGFLHASCFSFDPVSILLKPARHIRKVKSSIRLLVPHYKSFKKRIDRLTYEGMDKSAPVIVDWVSGCFLVVKASFFIEIGGFDERYFMYFEDVDLCRKARQYSKLVLFDPRVSVVHRAAHQSARSKGIFRSIFFNPVARYHLFSWIQYCIKWNKDLYSKFVGIFIAFATRRPRNVTPGGYSLGFSTFSRYR